MMGASSRVINSKSRLMDSRSNIYDRSASNLKISSAKGSIIGQSNLSPDKSFKDVSLSKLDTNPRTNITTEINEQNFIICMDDCEEIDKLYNFVIAQKEDNWKLIKYNEKNFDKVRKEV